MKVFLPDRPPEPPRAPEWKDRAFSAALLVIFVAIEIWRAPAAAAAYHRATGFWSLLWWCCRTAFPMLPAGYAIRGAWVGEVPSGLYLIEQVARFVFVKGLELGNGPIEYRDEDSTSFYFGVALHFVVAVWAVLLLTR